MTRFEITEEIFKSWVDWRSMIKGSRCKISPRAGNFSGTSGHENCGSCPGNYYNGGECNYGGHHVLAKEISRINKNFNGLDSLIKRHNRLKIAITDTKDKFEKEKASLLHDFNTAKKHCSDINHFIYGSCIGIEKQKPKFLNNVKKRFENAVKNINNYIQSVEKVSWQQMQDFQNKLKKAEDIKKEIAGLQEDYKNSTDTAERARLDEMIKGKKNDLRQLSQELGNHHAKEFWNQETVGLLTNLRQYLATGSYPAGNLGKSKGLGERIRGDKTNQKNQDGNNQNSFLSPKNKEFLKNVGVGILVIAMLGIVYGIIKSQLQE